ncbi:MAG: ATP-binding protein, partial [Sphingomonadales bacterium]
MSIPCLPSDQLTVRYDHAGFAFRTTDELEPLEVAIGQDRALDAINFGSEIARPGYNMFLMGPEGSGKYDIIMARLREKAASEPAPDDWVYVHNFEESHRPEVLRLPPGRGRELADAMARLVEDVRSTVPTGFEREENQRRITDILDDFQQKQQDAFEDLREAAGKKSIALIRTPMGFGFAPMADDKVMKPEVFEKLPESDRKRFEQDIEALQTDLQKIIRQVPVWDRERRHAIRELNREVTTLAVSASIELVREQFKEIDEVVQHLDEVRKDLVENFAAIMRAELSTAQQRGSRDRTSGEGDNGEDASAVGGGGDVGARLPPGGFDVSGFDRYKVNALISHDSSGGAPVIFEDNPSIFNLLGRVEHMARFGALTTDFSLIQPGALHRANGGYLVIDARKLLMQPLSWEALKRALKAGQITIESPGQTLSLISTISLEPQPIPLNVKMAIFGDRFLYYTLCEHDAEFLELFKVEADFDDDMGRTSESEQAFMRVIAAFARNGDMKPFDAAGVARLMEQAVRIADDTLRLTLNRRQIVDLMQEADYFAGKAEAEHVTDAHVQAAIDAQIRRADRVREKNHESITRDIVRIETSGEAVGQINGLAILQLGSFIYGRPSRITARVRMGVGRLVDIEREAKLGGALHTKGVMILSGFLQSRYARDIPFSIAATIVFEQAYGGVDGDSASSTELYALLSALAEVPLRQDLGVTGSVDQCGQVQAI